MQNKNNNSDFLSKCSFCGSDFDAGNLTFLEEKEQRTVLHATCSGCGTSSIFYLSSNQAGMLSMGIATDLDKHEVKSKFLRNAVSADEVIDVHQFISRGDLMQLLK